MNDPSNNDEERLARLVREAGDPSVKPDPKYAEMLRAMILDRLGSAETESALVEPGTLSITSEEPRRPLVCAQTECDPERSCPNFFNRSLDNWRYIMRSPISRITAAAIFTCAVVGTMAWFNGPGATPAFADVVQQVLEMKSAKYTVAGKMEYSEHFKKNYKGGTFRYLNPNPRTFRKCPKGVTPFQDAMKGMQKAEPTEVLWSAPGLYYSENRKGTRNHSIRIHDYTKQKHTSLSPIHKRAIIEECPNRNAQGTIEKTQAILRKAKNDPKVESLGEKVIDGHNVVGYRVKEDGKDHGDYGRESTQIDIWADSKTLWPVRIEKALAYPSGVTSKTIMDKFEYNVKLDKSQFNDEPPADYDILYTRKMSSKD